jgi:hydrogenase-4 component E
MTPLSPQLLLFLETLLLASVILMHLAKRSQTVIWLYGAQSLIVSLVLIYASIREVSFLLMAAAGATFLVKVLFAPYFFIRLMKKHEIQFSASSYLNGPLTLIVVAGLTAFSYSHLFRNLTLLAPSQGKVLLLALSMMFVSIFLIVNRRGVLSQIVGILSLENAIVSFAYAAGLETTPGPQLGILFDLLIWIVIATGFASMIYRHFGTLNAGAMRNLKEE